MILGHSVQRRSENLAPMETEHHEFQVDTSSVMSVATGPDRQITDYKKRAAPGQYQLSLCVTPATRAVREPNSG